MAGSLISDMTGSQIVATLEILSQHGVEDRHLAFLRQFPRGAFAKKVAEVLQSGHGLYAQAILFNTELAVSAVWQIEDTDILKEVYAKSEDPAVWCAVMEKVSNENDLYHLVRVHDGPARREARLIGCRKVSKGVHHQLISNEWLNEVSQADIESIVNQVKQERRDRGEDSDNSPNRGNGVMN